MEFWSVFLQQKTKYDEKYTSGHFKWKWLIWLIFLVDISEISCFFSPNFPLGLYISLLLWFMFINSLHVYQLELDWMVQLEYHIKKVEPVFSQVKFSTTLSITTLIFFCLQVTLQEKGSGFSSLHVKTWCPIEVLFKNITHTIAHTLCPHPHTHTPTPTPTPTHTHTHTHTPDLFCPCSGILGDPFSSVSHKHTPSSLHSASIHRLLSLADGGGGTRWRAVYAITLR
jgi:hypothetical protein